MVIRIKGTRYCETPGFYFMLALFLNNKILVDIVRQTAIYYLPGMYDYIELMRNILYVCCFGFCCAAMLRRKMPLGLFLLIFAGVYAILFTIIAAPAVTAFWGKGLLILTSRVFVGYWFFRYAEDYPKILKYQTYFLIPTLIYTILVFSIGQTDGYMAISYNLLPSALLYLYYGLSAHKPIYSLCGTGILLVLSVFGARGAMLCGIISVVTYFLIGTKMTFKKGIAIFLAGCAATVMLWNITDILKWILQTVGTSRTITMLLQGKLFFDAGRMDFQPILWENLFSDIRFLLPRGLFYDRLYVADVLGVFEISEILYCHNIFLEILYHFGWILGSALIVMMLWTVCQAFLCILKSRNSADTILYFSFVLVAFGQLMVSNSYLLSYPWGISMGLCLNIVHRAKREGISHDDI